MILLFYIDFRKNTVVRVILKDLQHIIWPLIGYEIEKKWDKMSNIMRKPAINKGADLPCIRTVWSAPLSFSA